MKKTSLYISIIGIIAIALAYYMIQSSKISKKVRIDFPNNVLYDLDENQYSFDDIIDIDQENFIFVFNPWCEDCIGKIEELNKHEGKIKDRNIILIGNQEKKDTIENLFKRVPLDNLNKVKILITDSTIADSLNIFKMPMILLYTKEKGFLEVNDSYSIDDIANLIE